MIFVFLIVRGHHKLISLNMRFSDLGSETRYTDFALSTCHMPHALPRNLELS